MNATSEILYMVHDLRNPLSAIRSSAELLIRSSLSEPQIHRIASNLYGASVRMNELIEEFLLRHQALEKRAEPIRVRDLVAGAVDKIAGIAESQSVEIIQEVPESLAIEVDRHRFQCVLVNLFVNALEVMPDGGTIRIAAIPDRHSVRLEVSDTGPGIDPEIRGRLFQPFATAGKENGLGLGLALSRQTVIDLGGEIWAEPSGDSTCFAVRLPRTVLQSCAGQN